MRFAIPPPVLTALRQLHAGGFEAYLVGGCVRDDLLGIEPHDYDIATSAAPEQIAAAFPDTRLLLAGIKHGTVTPLLDGMPVEITSFRRDGPYSDGRRPDHVSFSTQLLDDVARRDFTINALAWSEHTGLIDLVGGAEDCRNKLIRAVGDPDKRFGEDALRMLRALRFASVLGFTIEDCTAAAMARHAALLDHVSVERIAVEISGALQGTYVSAVGHHPQVLLSALPELLCAYPEHTAQNLLHAACIVQSLPVDLPLRFVALFVGGVEAGPAARSAERLRLSNALKNDISTLAEYAHTNLMPHDARVWLAQLGLPMLLRVIALQRAWTSDTTQWQTLDTLAQQAQDAAASGACQSLRDLAINGRDLLNVGFSKGPAVGAALGQLMRQVVTGQLPNTREALLQAAQNIKNTACNM